MKKTFNINVAGFPFIIDDDAYTLLSDYLDTIEHAFARLDDSRELINDIESRVAELLLERTAEGSPIVTAADVEDVIHRIGQPEDMIEESETISVNPETGETVATEEVKDTGTPPPYIPPLPPVSKKLFRDPQNAMLGGVCAGIANYMKCDPTVVRLLTVLITIVSFATGGLAYLILWIVVPEAVTPLQRMQMLGEQPTMENIGKTVTDNFREDNSPAAENPNNHPTNFGSAMANLFGMLAKIAIIIGLIIGFPILVALAVGLIGCIFALIAFGTSWGGVMFGESMPDFFTEAGNIPVYGVLVGIGAILVIGIPLFILVRKAWRRDNVPLPQKMRNTLVVVWLIGFILAAFSTGRIINLSDEQDHIRHERYLERRNEYRQKRERQRERREEIRRNREQRREQIVQRAEEVAAQAEAIATQTNGWVINGESVSRTAKQLAKDTTQKADSVSNQK